MAQKDYADILCQAVDEIVTKKLEGISFDKTINCTIIDDKKAKDGQYKVTDGSTKFYAYSASTDYKENDAVYVTVPNGDFNNQKIIIGKQVTNNTSPFLFTTPFDTIVDVSTNLINDKNTEGYLRANDPTETQVLLWEKDFTANDQDIAGFTRLGLQGQFRSWLDSFKCISGNYGYKLILHCKEEVVKTEENNYDLAIQKLNELLENDQAYFGNDEIKNYIEITCNITNIPWEEFKKEITDSSNWNEVKIRYSINEILEFLQSNRKEISYAQYELFLSSSNDMYGNPYNFESYYQQEKVFDISAIKEIQKMELYFYQEPQSFIDKNEKQVPYNDDFGNPLLPNLFTKDAYICLGYDVASFDNDQVNIYCLDSKTYSDHYLLEDNEKHIILRWIHQFDDGRVKSVPDTTDLQYEIRWYQYKLGAPSADEYSGVYWKRLDGNNFYYTLKPDIKKEIEQIKAIILFNNKVIRSNILTFTNEKEVINEATSNFLAGLNIWCKDNTYGNYYIYDPGNKMLEQYDVKQARELNALFSTQANLMTSESEGSLLTEATSITWTFPTVSTMLTVYGIDYSVPYPDKDNAQFQVCAPQGMTAKQAIKEIFDGANLHTLTYELDDGSIVIYDHIAKTIEITRYGDINNAEAIDASQLYFVKKDYIQSYANNVVQCSIIKNHTEYFTSKTFYFGQAGTTGTDVTLKIYIDPADKFALTKQEGGDTMHLRAMLFDSHNKEVNPNDRSNYEDVTYEWSWFDYKYEDNDAQNRDILVQIEPFIGSSTSNATPETASQIIKNKQWVYDSEEDEYLFEDKTSYYTNSARNEIVLSVNENFDMNHFLILQCIVKGWGDYPLTAYKPIAIRLGETYSYVDCANEVIYLTSGYPEYYKEAWKIHLQDIDEDNDGYEDEYIDGQWKIFNPYDENSLYIGEFNSKQALLPIGIYMENVHQYGAQYLDENNQIVWTQPIVCLKNNYPSGTLNKWSGKEIEINKESGYILSPAIAAGKKNNEDNTFSGVMLGDWSVDPLGVNSFIGNQTGVYGFHHGMVSYALMEDGTAFIGKAGHGRIYIDGNKSTIQSEGYNLGHGVLIDLDDNLIEMKNGSGGIYLDASDDLKIDFSTKNGDSLFLLDTQTGQYYLKSEDYEYGKEGILIDLAENRIYAYNFILEASGEGGTLTLDSSHETHPFNVNDKFLIGWDGSVTATWGTIGGFTISDHSIFGGPFTKPTDFASAEAINIFGAKTYWGATSHNADTYDFRLGNTLIYRGNKSGANSSGRMYLASNLYSFKAEDIDITSSDQLNNMSYFLFGINFNDNLQIGTAGSSTTYENVHIYGGKTGAAFHVIPEGDTNKESSLKVSAAEVVIRNTAEVRIAGLASGTKLNVTGISPDNQFGIYARFG